MAAVHAHTVRHSPACARKRRLGLAVAAAGGAALVASSAAHAVVSGPYTVDANTMHLWHLDETTTPAVDQAHYNYNGAFTTKPDANQPLTALFGGGATLGNPSYSGFGNALSITNNLSGLAALTPANGTTDNADHTFDNPITHAFTFEAIIRVGFDPTATFATPQEIIAGEGDAGDSSDRSWQFRLEPHAVATDPWKLRFQKVSGFTATGSSTANYNLDANIPSSGVDAIVQNGWYHVAASFNGTLSDTTNLKLFWTKLDSSNSTASQIGAGQMNGFLRQQDTDFALGNELRDFNGNTEGLIGSIDEVRISDIARGANAFIFQPAGTTFWNVDANGAWETAANWTAGVPNAVSASAVFGGGGTPITAPRTISLTGGKTVGYLAFNSAIAYTLATTSTGALLLDNGATTSSIVVQAGTHTIGVPVTLTALGATVSVSNATDQLNITSTLGGNGTLTKAGVGTLRLSGNSTLANLSINGGTFLVDGGSIGAAAVAFGGSGGTLAYSTPGSFTVANNISGGGTVVGNFRHDGTGVVTLSGANNFGGGQVILTSGGTVRSGSAGGLTGAGAALVAGATLDLNGNGNGTGGALSGTGGTITDTAAGAGTTTFAIAGSAVTDYSGTITNGGSRIVALSKSGTGTTRLRSASSFSGGTRLTQGFLEVYDSAALGSGPITINPDTVVVGGASAARIFLGNNVTLPNNVTITTSNSGAATGSLQALNDSVVNLSGTIQINGNAISGGHFFAGTNSILRIGGAITAGPGVTSVNIRAGNIELSGGGSYPELRIDSGNTAITATNGIATNAVVNIGANASPTVAAVLELAGSSQTLAGLRNATSPNNAALVTDSLGGSVLTLAVGAGNTQTYSGSIGGGVGVRVTSGTQILTGGSTSALNGIFDYSGGTTVAGGTLQLGPTVHTIATAGNGVNITRGSLVFDYTGGTTPAAALIVGLDASYNNNFATGQVRSSTADGRRGLGYRDDATGSKFTITYTFYGDADLDRDVDFDDLLSLARNYSTSPTVDAWAKGDSNYDNAVNFDDLLNLAKNYGAVLAPAQAAQFSADFAADFALAQSLVPEPTSIAALAGLALIGSARRRRV